MQQKTLWQIMAEHKRILLVLYAIFAVVIIGLASFGVYRHFTMETTITQIVGEDPISGSPIYETNYSYPFKEGEEPPELFGTENLTTVIPSNYIVKALDSVKQFFGTKYPEDKLRRISIVKNSLEMSSDESGKNVYVFRVAFNNDINLQVKATIVVDNITDPAVSIE